VHLRIFNAHNRLCAEVINKKVIYFMKKKLLAIASAAVVAASLLVVGISSSNKSDGIFDENVEALANDECDFSYSLQCDKSGISGHYTFQKCDECNRFYKLSGQVRALCM